MNYETNANQYYGKTIERIEDSYGNELSDMEMADGVTLIFTDGDKVRLGADVRGNDCYISQYIEKTDPEYQSFA